MIWGIGTDILSIERLRRAMEAGGEPFLEKTFTQQERVLIESRPTPPFSYATRFAGKEAVFKALRMQPGDFRLADVEILQEASEAPVVCLHGRALQHANQNEIYKIHISLSYDGDNAIAYAVAEQK